MGFVIICGTIVSVCTIILIVATEDNELVSVCSFCISVFGVALLLLLIWGISVQTTSELEVYDMEQERNSLVDSYNTYATDYVNDIVHYESIKEIRSAIADFNSRLNTTNELYDSFWVGFFYVDCSSIEPITISDGVAK